MDKEITRDSMDLADLEVKDVYSMSDEERLCEIVLGQREMRKIIREFSKALSEPGAMMKMMAGAFKR
jgi:hypothetical protein